mgnify:CR=1 FL=1
MRNGIYVVVGIMLSGLPVNAAYCSTTSPTPYLDAQIKQYSSSVPVIETPYGAYRTSAKQPATQTQSGAIITNNPADAYIGGQVPKNARIYAELPEAENAFYLKQKFDPVKPYNFAEPKTNDKKLDQDAMQRAAWLFAATREPVQPIDWYGYYKMPEKTKSQTDTSYAIKEPVIRSVSKDTSTTIATNQESTFGNNVSVYTSNPKDPKTYGRKIRIEYPAGWESKAGISPHNVYKFIDRQYQKKDYSIPRGRSCLVNIIDVGESLSQTEWQAEFSEPDFAESLWGDQMKILYSKATQADFLPALMSVVEFTQEQIGLKLFSKMLMMSVGYKNTLINLQCIAMSGDKDDVNDIFEESKVLFLSFMNSFKCQDRWENPNVTASEMGF